MFELIYLPKQWRQNSERNPKYAVENGKMVFAMVDFRALSLGSLSSLADKTESIFFVKPCNFIISTGLHE